MIGAHDLKKSKTLNRIGVKNYIPHPDYKTSPVRNDIMLLRVTTCLAVKQYLIRNASINLTHAMRIYLFVVLCLNDIMENT